MQIAMDLQKEQLYKSYEDPKEAPEMKTLPDPVGEERTYILRLAPTSPINQIDFFQLSFCKYLREAMKKHGPHPKPRYLCRSLTENQRLAVIEKAKVVEVEWYDYAVPDGEEPRQKSTADIFIEMIQLAKREKEYPEFITHDEFMTILQTQKDEAVKALEVDLQTARENCKKYEEKEVSHIENQRSLETKVGDLEGKMETALKQNETLRDKEIQLKKDADNSEREYRAEKGRWKKEKDALLRKLN